MKKNIWIIGSSSGIGLNLVKEFLKDGSNVIASARSAESSTALNELKKKYENLFLLNVDVSNIESIINTTKEIFSINDHLDTVFFNAGVYESMKYNEWNIKDFENMTNINYLGAVRVLNTLIPYFEKQGFGHCVFNASLSTYFGLPYGGAYSASKSALVNFAQSIQPELLAKNIQIQIINHGFVKTRLTAKNDFDMPELMDPEDAAKQIYNNLNDTYKFEIRFPYKLSLFLRFLNLLPYKLSLSITKRFLK